MRRSFRFRNSSGALEKAFGDPITHSGCQGMKTTEIRLFQFRVKHAGPMVIFGVGPTCFRLPAEVPRGLSVRMKSQIHARTGKEHHERYKQPGIEKYGEYQSASSQHGREECLGRLHARCRPCDSRPIRLSIRGGKLARNALDTSTGCLSSPEIG